MQTVKWFGGEKTELEIATVFENSTRVDAESTAPVRKRASFFSGLDGKGEPFSPGPGHWWRSGVTVGTRRCVPPSFLAGS